MRRHEGRNTNGERHLWGWSVSKPDGPWKPAIDGTTCCHLLCAFPSLADFIWTSHLIPSSSLAPLPLLFGEKRKSIYVPRTLHGFSLSSDHPYFKVRKVQQGVV